MASFIIRIVRVPFDPLPSDLVHTLQSFEFFPQIAVFDGMPSRFTLLSVNPPVGFPSANPLHHSILHILGIRPHNDDTRLLQSTQTFDYCAKFHSVVRGVRFRTTEIGDVTLMTKHVSPPTGTGISDARTISRQNCLFNHAARRWTSRRSTQTAPARTEHHSGGTSTHQASTACSLV